METIKPAMRTAVSVWLVEDVPLYRNELVSLLDEVTDLRCGGAFATCEEMLEALNREAEAPDVVLMDIELHGGRLNGIEAISLLKDRVPEAAVLMLTIHDTAERIFAALKAGASGYLVKPAAVDTVVFAIREAHRGGLLMPPAVARKVRGFFTGSGADYGLSSRELEILQLMEQGAAQRHIAETLFLSHHTIDSHLRNIYRKLHVRSGVQAVARAIRERLL